MEQFHLRNKKILITGASSGIGRQCAVTCSKAGADIILAGRNRLRLEETYDMLLKGNHQIVSCDLTDFVESERIIDATIQNSGKLSGLVHAAGIEITIPLRAMRFQKLFDLLKINTISALELSRIISKNIYCPDNGSSIVFISSIMDTVGQPGKSAYCASKAALLGAVRALALELAYKKIRVNAISPAIVRTPLSEHLLSSLTNFCCKSTCISP